MTGTIFFIYLFYPRNKKGENIIKHHPRVCPSPKPNKDSGYLLRVLVRAVGARCGSVCVRPEAEGGGDEHQVRLRGSDAAPPETEWASGGRFLLSSRQPNPPNPNTAASAPPSCYTHRPAAGAAGAAARGNLAPSGR